VRNIQIIDGALNATFSIFQATDTEFEAIFPDLGQDIEVVEDFFERSGDERASAILGEIWKRPVYKGEANGIHGTLYYDYQERRKYLPSSKREIDRDPSYINEWERFLYAKRRAER